MKYIYEFSYDYNYEKNEIRKTIDRQEVIAETKDEVAYKKNYSIEAIGTICKKGHKVITSSTQSELDTIDVYDCRSLSQYCTSYSLMSNEEDLNQKEIDNIFGIMYQGLREYVVGKVVAFDEAIEKCSEQKVIRNYQEEEEEEKVEA